MNSRTHIKIQKSAIFVKKMKINVLQIKNIVNLGAIVIIQENIEVYKEIYKENILYVI